MVRAQGSQNGFFNQDGREGVRLSELVILMVLALGVVLLIAASSLRFEAGRVQDVRDGEAVPIRVVAPGQG